MSSQTILLVTIDSNVLIHLFNPSVNTDRHIEILLTFFRSHEFRACVDKKVIPMEYHAVVQKWMRNKDQDGNEVILARHWLDPDNQERIEVDRQGAVYSTVEKIIKRHVKRKRLKDADWRRDCMFVSVSCMALCKLVTNDMGHILASRSELRDEVPNVHVSWNDEIDFLSSREAHAHFCTPGE
jgi:hypothetical protein